MILIESSGASHTAVGTLAWKCVVLESASHQKSISNSLVAFPPADADGDDGSHF